MPDGDHVRPRPEGEYPPPPPVEAPTSDPKSGSLVLGVVIGLVATVGGAFLPLLASSTEDVLLNGGPAR